MKNPLILVWVGLASPQVEALGFLAVTRKVFTIDRLQRRGLIVDGMSDLCVMCKMKELVNHLFSIVSLLLQFGLISFIDAGWLGGFQVMSRILQSWMQLLLWRIIPFAVLWSIWRERSEKTFRDSSLLTKDVIPWLA